MERELTLRIILEKPPADVDFGLQKGRGSDYETSQKQRSKAKDLYFEFTVGVKDGRKDALPTFVGPFAQVRPLSDSSISTSAPMPVRQTRFGADG